MRTRPTKRLALATLACAGLLTAGPTAWGQSSTQDAQTLDAEVQPRTVIRLVRPLRTFRGEAVRVGGSQPELSIGVVRPIREGGSTDDRVIYHRRAVVDAYPDVYPYRYGRPDESIGVVRAYRTYDPPQRSEVVIFRNANAQPTADDNTAVNTLSPDNPAVYAVRSVGDLPEPQQTDPWALLNAGFYRDARALFAQQEPTPESRTGQALAATLSGDAQAGASLMPDTPTLGQGVTLSTATRSRIVQSADLFYGDNAEARQALKTLAGNDQTESVN